jgi:hypothetical protein
VQEALSAKSASVSSDAGLFNLKVGPFEAR